MYVSQIILFLFDILKSHSRRYVTFVMAEKSSEQDVESGTDSSSNSRPKSASWFRLVYDQAYITPEVQNWNYRGSGTEDDPFVVVWIDNDPRNPMLWASWKKWCLVGLVSIATLAVAFVSSAYTGGLSEVLVKFNTTEEVVTCT